MSKSPDLVATVANPTLSSTALVTAVSESLESVGGLSDDNVDLFATPKERARESNATAAPIVALLTKAAALQSEFDRSGTGKYIDEVIDCRNQALSLIPKGHAQRPAQLSDLGNAYLSRFEQFDNVSDLHEAVECHHQAVQLTLGAHLDSTSRLTNLGSLYRIRFDRLGVLADINRAIECQSQALLLTPEGHKEQPVRLSTLGNSYLRRFNRLGEHSDVGHAIEYQRKAFLLTPDGHEDQPSRLNNLGSTYQRRFELLGEPKDIDQAIECLSDAVLLTPNGHSVKPGRLNNLGTSYLCRFERLGNLADLGQAIECQAQAIQLTPNGHANMPSRLNNLGGSYLRRFEHQGELADINNAINCFDQATLLTPDGHAVKPSRLGNLGTSYLRRFSRFGNIPDIDKAIECHTQAVLLTPSGHPYKPSWLRSLGSSFALRFHRLRERVDIDQAIKYHMQALDLTAEEHADRPTGLNSLGNAYMRRFEYLKEISDINLAIKFQSQALQLTPEDHVDKSRMLSNLGSSYIYRFDYPESDSDDTSDVDKGIELHHKALLLITDEGEDTAILLNNLGHAYKCRFQRSGKISDADNAIEYQRQAVLLIPDGHAEKPNMLNNLGDSYMGRYRCRRDHSDVSRAQESFKKAAQLPVINPLVQVKSARAWATSLSLLGISPLPAYRRAMELVPQLAWLGTTIGGRFGLLELIGGLAMEAASFAISIQNYPQALEWLEEGRSIVWNQTLRLRTPFDDLQDKDPVLAERLYEVGQQLESAGSRAVATLMSINYMQSLNQEAERHHRLASEWDDLLKKARQLPGFHNFMLPRKAHELLPAAKNGPLVIINVDTARCDALIILPTRRDITHVPLETFTQHKAISAAAHLKTTTDQGSRGLKLKYPNPRSESEQAFTSILATLWSDIVKPVLDSLGYLCAPPVDKLPCITWCTTGPLSFLPLHAAGSYSDSAPNAPSLVVSSYTPTLGALLSATPQISTSGSGILTVAQAYTKGLSNLPNTIHELAAIKEHAKEILYSQLDGDSATTEGVLNAMEEHSWVHLACHATQNISNPAHSAFHLSNGALTLEAITKKTFKNKGLAFLSACQTATGDSKLPDEAIHLAAGMLMAGYPSVIATMWSIWDVDGPEVVSRVYAELFRDGKMDIAGTAWALHKAVAGLRREVGAGSFERWVPFIHIGV